MNLRDRISWLIATKPTKKRIKEGVTDDDFSNYRVYVDLIAKSLRRLANERNAYTVMNWRLPHDWSSSGVDRLSEYSDEETKTLNKWAEILSIVDSDLMDESYYAPFWDFVLDTRTEPVKFDSKGRPTSYIMMWNQEETEEIQRLEEDFKLHEQAIHNIQKDILMELAENHTYMWD